VLVVGGFVAVSIIFADTFSAVAEVLQLHVVGAQGVQNDGGVVLRTPRRRRRSNSK